MQAVGVCKGQPCLLVARFLHWDAHSSKLRTSLLYRTASSGLRLKLQPPHGLLQVSSSLDEDTQENDAGTKVVKVKFVLQRRCEFGQQFSVTGDEELFGAWAPEAAIPMQWSEGHIWTVELDLSVGTSVEYKVVLMAEQEVLEWQPGPNRQLEVSGDLSSHIVFVPWSDEEDVEMNEFPRTQGVAEEEQMIEERSTNSGMINANAKDFLDEWQTEAKGIATGDQETIDARTSLNSEVKSAKVMSPFAIPESWYGEEDEETSGLLSSHDSKTSTPFSLEDIAKGETSDLLSSNDSTASTPVSVKDIAKGETVISAIKFTSDNDDMEEENGEKLMLSNRPDEVIVGRASSMMLTREFEPITKDDKDEELRLCDVPVEVTSERNVGTLLSDTELKDINEESSEKHVVQNGPVKVITETSSGTTTVSTNQDYNDKEVMIDNEPSVMIAEVPENEIQSMATDSLENVETKPAKEKRWGPKGWSKLWSAFVYGHND